MSCLICGGTAQVWDYPRGGKSVDCVECSRYDVTGSVLELRAVGARRFDVDQTRLWLESRRIIDPDHPPLIDSNVVRWAR